MAKKITFTLLVLLIASAFVFVSCDQEAGGTDKPGKQEGSKIEIEVRDPLEENTKGTPAVITDLYNMNFDESAESSNDSDVAVDGASATKAPGQGINGSTALAVTTSTNYGTTLIDITPYYAEGKSYYVEASLKNNGSTNTTGLTAYVSYTVCSGVVKDYFDEYYDCDDIYGAPFMDEDDAIALFGDTYQTRGTLLGIELKDDSYITLSGIIPAVEIDSMIVEQTKKYAESEDDEVSLDYLNVCFYVGDYPNQNGRSFLIDDVVIIDLNSEIEATGKTHRAKESEGDGGDSASQD